MLVIHFDPFIREKIWPLLLLRDCVMMSSPGTPTCMGMGMIQSTTTLGFALKCKFLFEENLPWKKFVGLEDLV